MLKSPRSKSLSVIPNIFKSNSMNFFPPFVFACTRQRSHQYLAQTPTPYFGVNSSPILGKSIFGRKPVASRMSDLDQPPYPDSPPIPSDDESDDDVPSPPQSNEVYNEPVSVELPAVTPQPSTETPVVPVSPAPIPVPVLRGKFTRGPSGAWTLRGAWTMTENDTVSSEFEFVQRVEPTATIPPEVPPQPTSNDGETVPTTTRAGDDAAHPPSGVYDGYFMMKRFALPEAKIVEHGVKFTLRPLDAGEVVDIPGVSTALQPGDWYMFGAGANEFGTFELRGRFVPSTNEVCLGKAYITVTMVAVPPTTHKKGQFVSKPKSGGGAGSTVKRPTGQPGPPKPRAPKPTPPPPSQADAIQREQRKRAVPNHLRDALSGIGVGMSGPLAACARILEQLMSHQFAYPFLAPVDPVALNIPDYPRVIKRPMDLGTIKHKLENGAYMSHDEFADDVRTTFNNAMLYNASGTDIYNMADRLKTRFSEQWKNLMKNMDRDGNVGAGFSAGLDSDSDEGGKPKKASGGGGAHKPHRPPEKKTSSGGTGQPKKRVRPPAEPSSNKRQAPPQSNVMPYMEPSLGVSNTEVAELKSELQALRMQLRMMAAMTANAQMQVPHVKVGELTYEEKRDLSMRINQLDADKLAKVVQIIAERMPLGSHSASEDIEIDIDALDVDTLRRLQDFVKVGAPKPKRAAAPAKSKQDLLKTVAQETEANKQRILAMEKVGSAMGGGAPTSNSIRPVGGYGSDSDSDSDAEPPPPPPGLRF